MSSFSEAAALFEESPDGIGLVRDGRWALVNEALASLLGMPAEALIGQPIESGVAESDRRVLTSWVADAEGATIEVRFLHEDGSPRMIALTPVRGQSEVGVIARDVTGQRREEMELLVADRMMSIGALAAGVAHDINNPLSYVLGNLDFLLGELPATLSPDGVATADILEAAAEAREGAERVRRIVSDLRAFARADAGTTRNLDLVRVVESAINMAIVEVRHRARLERRLEPVPPLRANEARLGQLVLNLLLNAAQVMAGSTKEDNLIEVATWEEDGLACLSVQDNGPGIPPEVLGRLFDPFFTTKPKGVGNGLGLAMAQAVVNELGGTIDVASEVGVGTRFEVRLPSSSRRSRLRADSTEGSAPARVLVADDDPLVCGVLERQLVTDGHAVDVVGSGEAAVGRLAEADGYDVVVCDVSMPGLDGMQLCAWMEAHRPELVARTIFLSGGVSSEVLRRFLNECEALNVDKPFEPAAVSRLVGQLAGESKRPLR